LVPLQNTTMMTGSRSQMTDVNYGHVYQGIVFEITPCIFNRI